MNTFLPIFYMNSIFPTKYIYDRFPTISGPAYWVLVVLIILILLFLVINLISGIIELGRAGTREVNLFGTNRSSSLRDATADFISSNSIIAKIAFIIVVLILFVLVLRFGITMLSWVFSPVPSPHLFDGMIDAKQAEIFAQDPRSSNHVPIVRSTNGLGFTWSCWIYIDDYEYLKTQYKHVFSKGNSDLNSKGLVHPNNAPGVYLTPNTNDLLVIMNSYETINEDILIKNIPLRKWVHIIVRCDGSIVDVFINGVITQSIHLKSVAKQNYGDVSVSLNGGFSGNTSNLWYYNYPLGTAEIQALFKWGPNTTMAKKNVSGTNQNTYADYLSLRWFFGGIGDQYYPSSHGHHSRDFNGNLG